MAFTGGPIQIDLYTSTPTPPGDHIQTIHMNFPDAKWPLPRLQDASLIRPFNARMDAIATNQCGSRFAECGSMAAKLGAAAADYRDYRALLINSEDIVRLRPGHFRRADRGRFSPLRRRTRCSEYLVFTPPALLQFKLE